MNNLPEMTEAERMQEIAQLLATSIELAHKKEMWREQLETGKVASLKEIANNEKITDGYVSRVYRLTLLAPDIITAILCWLMRINC